MKHIASVIYTLVLLSSPSWAAPVFHAVIEGDDGGILNDDIFLTSFNTLADLQTLNHVSPTFTNIGTGQNIGGSSRSISGLTYDGNQYHMIIEGDDGGILNDDIFLTSFNSLADLQTLNHVSPTFTKIGTGQNIGGSSRSIRGLTFDGNQFHMIIEGDDGGLLNDDIFLTSFNSLADLQTLNHVSPTFTNIGTGQNIGGSSRSISGLTFDGNQYHMIIEGDDGGILNDDIFLTSFNSLADLQTLNHVSPTFTMIGTGQNIGGSSRSIRGLVNQNTVPVIVPEPSSIALLAIAICLQAFRVQLSGLRTHVLLYLKSRLHGRESFI